MSQTNRIDESFYVRGVKCAAWLYLPANHSQGPVPAVVIGHGLGGVREWRLDNFAQAFRAAGYACLVFDYRGFGESDGAHGKWWNRKCCWKTGGRRLSTLVLARKLIRIALCCLAHRSAVGM